MKGIEEDIIKTFGNKLRVRVCGICIEGDKVLLIKHLSVGPKGVLWVPPGGGVNFGESAEDCLKREFLEETGLEIDIMKFLFLHEFLHPPLHAMELFFEVKIKGGNLEKGTDPEMSDNKQIIHEIKFLSYQEIKKQDPETLHNILNLTNSAEELIQTTGYFKYQP